MFVIKIGWRNILRNKKRSSLCALSIGVGLAAVILSDGFTRGMINNMVDEVTTVFLGEGQIISRAFKETNEVENTLDNIESLREKLAKDSLVRSFSERVQAMAMISTPEDVRNISLMGIDWDTEREVSELFNRVRPNKIDELSGNKIIIGTKLAKRLNVRIGEKIIVTAAESQTDEVIQELFRVAALFDMGSKEMNEGIAFIGIKKAKEMLKLPAGNYIALRFADRVLPAKTFWESYSNEKNVALSWKEISPAFTNAIEMSEYSSFIVAGILFIIVAFGIMNTLFMSIFDRLYEFGVLKSIGTKPLKIALMVVSESFWLTIVSMLFAGVITLGFGIYLAQVGISYNGIEFESMTFSKPIKAEFSFFQFVFFPGLILAFTSLISIYPARYAAKIKAVDAMKKSL